MAYHLTVQICWLNFLISSLTNIPVEISNDTLISHLSNYTCPFFMLYLKSTIIYVWDIQMWNLTRNIKETDTYQAFFPGKDSITSFFFSPEKHNILIDLQIRKSVHGGHCDNSDV